MSECIDSGLLRESLLKTSADLKYKPLQGNCPQGAFAIMSVNSIVRKVVKEFIAFVLPN